MKKEEIGEEIWDKALKGQEKAIEEVLIALEPLIKASIKKYYYRKDIFEELVMDGKYEVYKALRTYDKTKGVHILGYIKTYLRYFYLNKNKERKEISLDQENEEGLRMIDLIESKEDLEGDYIRKESYEFLRKSMESLTESEREVIEMFYLYSMSISQIAEKRGNSYRTIVNTKTRALIKLKKKIVERAW